MLVNQNAAIKYKKKTTKTKCFSSTLRNYFYYSSITQSTIEMQDKQERTDNSQSVWPPPPHFPHPTALRWHPCCPWPPMYSEGWMPDTPTQQILSSTLWCFTFYDKTTNMSCMYLTYKYLMCSYRQRFASVSLNPAEWTKCTHFWKQEKIFLLVISQLQICDYILPFVPCFFNSFDQH